MRVAQRSEYVAKFKRQQAATKTLLAVMDLHHRLFDYFSQLAARHAHGGTETHADRVASDVVLVDIVGLGSAWLVLPLPLQKQSGLPATHSRATAGGQELVTKASMDLKLSLTLRSSVTRARRRGHRN